MHHKYKYLLHQWAEQFDSRRKEVWGHGYRRGQLVVPRRSDLCYTPAVRLCSPQGRLPPLGTHHSRQPGPPTRHT